MPNQTPLSAIAEQLAQVTIVYTDLDGTMLGANGSFVHAPDFSATTEPVRALLAAFDAGIEIVPVSGRALRGLQGDARLLGMSMVIAEMGALVSYDFGREVVELFGDTPKSEHRPAAVMSETGAVDLIMSKFAEDLEFHLPWSEWRECTQLFRGRVETRDVNLALADEGMTWLELHDNGTLHGSYLGKPAGTCSAYHLIPKGVSKGSAVEYDLERRHIPREASVAIGDAHADLALADFAGITVMVADALDRDPTLAQACASHERVAVTQAPGNLGWVELLDAIVEAKRG